MEKKQNWAEGDAKLTLWELQSLNGPPEDALGWDGQILKPLLPQELDVGCSGKGAILREEELFSWYNQSLTGLADEAIW